MENLALLDTGHNFLTETKILSEKIGLILLYNSQSLYKSAPKIRHKRKPTKYDICFNWNLF